MNIQEYTPIFRVTGSKGSIEVYAWFIDIAVLEATTHFDIGTEAGVFATWTGKGSEPLTQYSAKYNQELKRIRP